MTQSLIIRDSGDLAIDPRRAISQAEEAATALMEVVEKQHLYLEQRGKRHLNIEAWELLGHFYGMSAGIACLADVKDIYDAGEWVGAEAYATLVDRDGQKLGGASAICHRNEPGREEMPIFQVRSMAQTRAVSKAYRLKLAFVAVLAGFSGTPAEELSQEEREAKMNMPLCPAHPRRVPREWEDRSSGQVVWKCTAKVGDGWCKWTAPHQATERAQQPGSKPVPTEHDEQLTSLSNLAKRVYGETWADNLKATVLETYGLDTPRDLTGEQIAEVMAVLNQLLDNTLEAKEA